VSLQGILEQIQQAGDAQVQEIRTLAEREAEAILAEARARSEQAYQAAYRLAIAPESGSCARIRNQARFEADCLVGQARERLVDMVLQQVREQLRGIRGTEAYPDALRRILLEVMPGENGLHKIEQRIVLEADPRDREVLEALLKEKGLVVQVDYSLSCWGGLNAHSPDGTVRLINTLESRLEKALPFLKQQLSASFERMPGTKHEKVAIKNVGL